MITHLSNSERSPTAGSRARSLAGLCGLAVVMLLARSGVAEDDRAELLSRFESQIWPILRRGTGDDSCVGCHDSTHKSDLRFFDDAASSFDMLVRRGYLGAENPDSLLARVAAERKRKRMPPGRREAWSVGDVDKLRGFLEQVRRASSIDANARRGDEEFPGELSRPFRGSKPTGLDNTFLTFVQLRGKIRAIFDDDWIRGGVDHFEKNVALFGGADFKTRFNESSTASTTFLSALDALARDVCSRAFDRRTGPFSDLPREIESLDEHAIQQLYRRILFRDASTTEIARAQGLLATVLENRSQIESGDQLLAFECTVRDRQTGLTRSHNLELPALGTTSGLVHRYIDQTAKPVDRKHVATQTLEGAFRFESDQTGQFVAIHNVNTRGNVSFRGISLTPVGIAEETLESSTLRTTADSPSLRLEGAWETSSRHGFTSFEDGDQHKGGCSIRVPVRVPRTGDYRVTVHFRASEGNATSVLVEVASASPSDLVVPPKPAVPPPNTARFWIDQSDDTVAFADLGATFRFSRDDYVEVSNEGTTQRVTADAVRFTPSWSSRVESKPGPRPFLVDNHEADLREGWKDFGRAMFNAYNQVGKDRYHDDNQRKGELRLRYRPSIRDDEWDERVFYSAGVGYPAKRDHERYTPITVVARESSPIVHIAHPPRAVAGAEVVFDASASYTVHRGELEFAWKQTGGSPAEISTDPTGAIATIRVPRRDARREGWIGLATALLRHPDFLFTRPPSIAAVTEAHARLRLQLVKIALDLVGRPPTHEEFSELDPQDASNSLDRAVTRYLASEDFRTVYFHRIRLYLESHGSETQDEPARLWCYVAFNDRPIQEILTADYSVDRELRKVMRPDHHGRSGILTTAGFIEGKPGLPHFNYAAQVAEKFLGYVFEITPEVEAERETQTAASTVDPESSCYGCHKLLTPLAYQRSRWGDDGKYRERDENGAYIDDSDRSVVPSYAFSGRGMEAFALQAARKERFLRTMINTHFTFFFGRELRIQRDERVLYREIWDALHAGKLSIRALIRAIMASPEYLEGRAR